MRRLALIATLLMANIGSVAFAQNQDTSTPSVMAGFVVVDQDRLFSDSLFGQRARAELLSESNVLAEENRRIEAELVAEEQELTEIRSTLAAKEFRELADAFDDRVTDIRVRQDRKARALSERQTVERQEFFQTALPILQQLLQEAGASAMFDRRSVLISLGSVDVTDAAITQIDAVLGDGVGTILETPTQPIQSDDQN